MVLGNLAANSVVGTNGAVVGSLGGSHASLREAYGVVFLIHQDVLLLDSEPAKKG